MAAGVLFHTAAYTFMSALGWSTASEDVVENLSAGLLFAHPFYLLGGGVILGQTRARRWANIMIWVGGVEVLLLSLMLLLPPALMAVNL